MKLVKTASGKQRIKISRKEWQDLGKKAGFWEEENDRKEQAKQEYDDRMGPDGPSTEEESRDDGIFQMNRQITSNIYNLSRVPQGKEKVQEILSKYPPVDQIQDYDILYKIVKELRRLMTESGLQW